MDESPAIGERSDAELLSAVRAGDDDAFASLWSRHELAARRLAGQIAPSSNVDDLVSESFYRVLRTIKAGGGPQDAFRPYLFSTMRRFNIDTGRSYYQRVALTGEAADLDVDHAESAADVAAISTEQRAAWLAWASLPDASRALLWHLVIEEETPAQIAPILGTSPNGVASRAVRAKERLRQAFLQQQLAAADTEQCREARNNFGAYVRDALSARDRAAVETHLDGCDRCRAALAEISDVNKTLRVVIAPIILGGAAIASRYLAVAAAAHGAAAVAPAPRMSAERPPRGHCERAHMACTRSRGPRSQESPQASQRASSSLGRSRPGRPCPARTAASVHWPSRWSAPAQPRRRSCHRLPPIRRQRGPHRRPSPRRQSGPRRQSEPRRRSGPPRRS